MSPISSFVWFFFYLQSEHSTRDLEEWDSMMQELEYAGDPNSPQPNELMHTNERSLTTSESSEPFVSPSRTDALSVKVSDGLCDFTATPSSLGSAHEPIPWSPPIFLFSPTLMIKLIVVSWCLIETFTLKVVRPYEGEMFQFRTIAICKIVSY